MTHQRSKSQPKSRLPLWTLRESLHFAPYLQPLHADPRWRKLLASIEK